MTKAARYLDTDEVKIIKGDTENEVKMMKDEKKLADIDALKKIYSNIDPNRRIYAERMIDQLHFMSETLTELQNVVKEEGPVATFVNGNGFEITQEHPAQKSYNSMIKNYNSTIKTLVDLLPKEEQDSDELLDFLGGGNS